MFIIMEKKFIFTVLLILRSCTRTELLSNEYDVSFIGIVSLSSYTFSFHLTWEARRERHISQIPGKFFFFHLTWEARRERRISQIPGKKQTVGGTMSRKVASQFSNKDIKYKSRNER